MTIWSLDNFCHSFFPCTGVMSHNRKLLWKLPKGYLFAIEQTRTLENIFIICINSLNSLFMKFPYLIFKWNSMMLKMIMVLQEANYTLFICKHINGINMHT